jgi:phosphoribosyl 1,2-cyclic phosphodiesterase
VQVTFWGTRGSIAVPGRGTARYGGNTSCVEVRTNDGALIICDCGTGARELGLHLLAQNRELHGHVFFSHTHWDHIQGWPFFMPAFHRGNEFTLHALAGINTSLSQVLANQMEYTYFPITLEQMDATINFQEVREGTFSLDGVKVTTHYLNHTCLCLGYRIEADGKTVVYASDTEPHGLTLEKESGRQSGPGAGPRLVHDQDRLLAEFVDGADLLILDAQYTDEEYPDRVGWGHATTGYAADIGVLAGVKRLALFHHDPMHVDRVVDGIVRRARLRAAAYGSAMEVFGAAEGLTVAV